MAYIPNPVPSNASDLPSFLKTELRNVSQAIGADNAGGWSVTSVAPTRLVDGETRYADGTNWNPGKGKGPYMYYGSAWKYLGDITTTANTFTGNNVFNTIPCLNATSATEGGELRFNYGNVYATPTDYGTGCWSMDVYGTTLRLIASKTNATMGGYFTFSEDGTFLLNTATKNHIEFNSNGVAAPTFSTRSVGTKIVYYPAVGPSGVDYATGIDGNTLWNSVPQNSAAYAFKWYGGTTHVATVDGVGSAWFKGELACDGNLHIHNSGPTIYLRDTDHRSAMIHCNGEWVYILRGDAANSESWTIDSSGYWPFQVNISNGAVITGNTLNARSHIGSDQGSFYTRWGPSDLRGCIYFGYLNDAYLHYDGGSYVFGGPGGRSGVYIPGYTHHDTGTRTRFWVNVGPNLYTDSPGNQPYSLYCEQWVGSNCFAAHSDERLKKNLANIPEDRGVEFVKSVQPITYEWKDGVTQGTQHGYSAQQMVVAGFGQLVVGKEDESITEEIVRDGVTFPAGARLSVTYDHAIPLLHAALKQSLKKNEELEERIAKLESLVEKLMGQNS